MHGEYSLLLAGLATKLLASLLRYWIGFHSSLYVGSDARNYDIDGRTWARDYLSHGHLPKIRSFTGSNFLRLLTALLYEIIPPSLLAAFFVFAWFSFCGYVMFWRAMRRTVKPGQDRRYLMLLLFMPSVAYWPSSLGKEAVVIFGLGMASLGFARSITGATFSGLALLGAGILLVTYVRPHVAIAVLVGIVAATIFQRHKAGQATSLVLTIALLAPVMVFTIGQANQYFKSDITNQTQANATLANARHRTAEGNSQFDSTPVQITNPVQFPYAAVTVIVRPFPWESPSFQELATSIESLFVVFLLFKNVKNSFGHVRRDNGYVIFSVVNIIVFIVLFSNFNNFGILARQRTQVAPFLFILLAMPLREAVKSKRSAAFAA